MSLLLIFTIMYASSRKIPREVTHEAPREVSWDRNHVKIYNSSNERWSCEDRGSYGIFCRSMHRPDTVTCMFYDMCGCFPLESKEWAMIHIHTCDTEFRCSLHTIATPKSEPHPIAMLIITIILLYVTLVIC